MGCFPAAHGCCRELGSREKGWSRRLGCGVTPARGRGSVPAPSPCPPCQVLSIPEHPQGLATWPTCHHCKMVDFNKKRKHFPKPQCKEGGEHHPVPPARCCQLCRGTMAAKWGAQAYGGHRRGSGVSEGIFPGRGDAGWRGRCGARCRGWLRFCSCGSGREQDAAAPACEGARRREG